MGGAAIADSGGNRGKKALDAELNLVPFIDLLCSLISFLLMTAVWTQIARLELKQGNAAPPDPNSTPPPKTDTVDLRVEVHEKGFTIVENNKIEIPIPCTAAQCVTITKGKDKDGHDTNDIESKYDYVALTAKLKEEKAKYPDNKNVTVVIADGVPYNEMIHTMDTSLDLGLDGLSVSGTPL
jgi:biopolymer transport protein TolR